MLLKKYLVSFSIVSLKSEKKIQHEIYFLDHSSSSLACYCKYFNLISFLSLNLVFSSFSALIVKNEEINLSVC